MGTKSKNKDYLDILHETRLWFYQNDKLFKKLPTTKRCYDKFYYLLYVKKDIKFIQKVINKQKEIINIRKLMEK